MSVITATLGYISVRGLEREGALVDRTFDRSLMSINFARAAATDFKALEAVAARRAFATDSAVRAAFDHKLGELAAEMDEDLSVSVGRAQSERAVAVGGKVESAVAEWKSAMSKVLSDTQDKAAWASFDHHAAIVAQELDLLINYTAGDGFKYRQSAHATINADRKFNIAATVLALALSGAIAWLLSRRLVLPIAKASEIAGRIADGDLGVAVPIGNDDEVGALLAAMDAMRSNIKASMEREVELRRSAQTRLAAALESSREGIVVVDADGRIALANAQASHLLGADGEPLSAGDPSDRVDAALARVSDGAAADYAAAHDVELAEGGWLRISRNRTQEGGSIFVYSDISLVKAQQAALKTANLWLDAALANLSHGLCLFDSANRLRVFNHRFVEMFGLPAAEVRHGMTFDALVALGFGDGCALQARRATPSAGGCCAAGGPTEHLHQLSQGRTISVSHRSLEEQSWLATYEDVTDRLQAAEKIAFMARHDSLTGLPNRAFFGERIEVALAAVDEGEAFALLCLDLDRFKEVNDTLGHPIGDELLVAVAGRLRNATRGTDLVARLGGDEFAIIQAIDTPQEAAALAQRIIAALAAPFEIEGTPLTIGVSIGISLAASDGRSYDALLKNADLALYRAKDEGRNKWHFFEPAMDEQQRVRRLLELDLRRALEHDQFELEYHPLVEVKTGRINGFEALLRLRHPVRGLVPPAEFIPVAEETGLIVDIGDGVLRRACCDAASWPGDVSVAVNVSGAQLRSGRLLAAVEAALDESGLPARRLILEITESVLIANAQTARTMLDKCKTMGIRIAMDDFGTGYSSLSYLRSFPFDMVKIDKSFVGEVTTRPESAAIVHAIIALSMSLGMRVTAEGVETEAQLAFLRSENCHAAQGFLFSRPVPLAVVPSLLEKRHQGPATLAGSKAA